MSKTQRAVLRLIVAVEVHVWLACLAARGMTPQLAWLEGDVWDAWDGVGSA